jgi:CheY-like chemotaxis protein
MLELKSPPPGRAKGTQATVRLPVVLPSTVMIIYGDKNLRLDLTRQLVDHGYNVVSNESDESAVGRVRQEDADLVILDWILPGMTGGVMIARIRNEKDLGNLPIVAITGRDMEPSKKDILDGFDIPHVVWPWNERELLDALYEATISKKRLEKLKK